MAPAKKKPDDKPDHPHGGPPGQQPPPAGVRTDVAVAVAAVGVAMVDIQLTLAPPVEPPPDGVFAVTARWTPNDAGEAVTGYKLYAGHTAGLYTAAGYPVTVGASPSYAFSIAAGSWYFALTAVNALGESGMSTEVHVTKP